MNYWTKIGSAAAVMLLCAASLSAMGSGSAVDSSAEREQQELAVTKVVLFSTGLGYFQRTGIVDGDASIDLRFKSKDINDLLKSMILQDLDSGSISSVNYSSREPLNVTLRSMPIDLSGNPGVVGILSQLRGEEIILDTIDGPTARGTIVGIENTTSREGWAVQTLNIYGKRGIVGVDVRSIKAVRFGDPYIEAEFRRALQLLTDSRSSDEKRVTYEFAGEGRRRVLVAYLLEAAIWKISYRLVLGEENEHVLQGWAIVENTTDEDWRDVSLSLVSGRPVSFNLPRKESAMVPIVDEVIEGERISIYNPRNGMTHPFNGLRFTNTTDIDLMGGPLTVFEAGTYAGDSQIGPVFSGDERILSFSLDLDTNIKTSVRGLVSRFVGIEIDKGVLVTETLNRQETDYLVTGRGIREKRVLMEHPVAPGWDLVEPGEPEERTASYYRFTVDLPVSGETGGTSAELHIAIERIERQKTDLLSANDYFIQTFIDSDFVGNSVKASLRGILERRQRLSDTIALRRTWENRRGVIYREQERIRKNMENLDEETDLYGQYVDTLTRQEVELGEIQDRIGGLTKQEQEQRQKLEAYVRSLQTR